MKDRLRAIGRFLHARLDWVLVAVLLAVATAVRLPYLHLIPVITDENFEVLAALSILRGNWIVFGLVDPTTGPLFAYAIALAYWIFGPDIYLARIVTMIFGVLTVGLTYVLGRAIAKAVTTSDGRRAGFIAGILLAFCPIHILINSHMAWSNCTTPFYVTLTLIVLHVAGARRDGRLLVLGGLLLGLAVQSHVVVLTMVPGLVVWFLARRDLRAWLRRPSPYLAVGAALLGYSNMIAYNLFSGGGILADARQYHAYAWSELPGWSEYWSNMNGMLHGLNVTLGGNLPRVQVPLEPLVAAVILIWLVVGLLYALRRRETLPFLVVLSTVLILPYFNKRYGDVYIQRYVGYLAPVGFSAMGLLVSGAIEGWRKRGWPAARAVAVGITILALLVAVYPVHTLFTYYDTQMRTGKNNAPTLYMATTLQKAVDPGTPVYLSYSVRGERASGGHRFLRSVSYMLTVAGVDNQILGLPKITRALEANPSQEAWLMLTPADYETLSPQFTLERIEGGPPAWNDAFLARYVPPAQAP